MGVKFGGYARRTRLERGISMKEVADKIEFSSAYVSDIEQGYRNPPATEKLIEWARVIGEDPDRFVRQARADRSRVELAVGEEDQAELAFKLERRWTSLTSEERRKILDFLGEDED